MTTPDCTLLCATRGNCNNGGRRFFPYRSLQPQFSTIRLLSFWTAKDALRGRRSAEDDVQTACVKGLQRFSRVLKGKVIPFQARCGPIKWVELYKFYWMKPSLHNTIDSSILQLVTSATCFDLAWPSSGLQRLVSINHLTPDDHYSGRTAPLTSKRWMLYIYSTNIGTEYFKHGIYSPLFSLQNAVCFTILTYLVPVLFTFYIQGVLKLKKKFWRQKVNVHNVAVPMGSYGLHCPCVLY